MPATEDDVAPAHLKGGVSYLPEPSASGDINPADLPLNLLGYLTNLKIYFASAGTMGIELYEIMGY